MSRGPAAWLEWMTSSAQARATAVGMSIGVSRSRPRPSRSEAVGAADSSAYACSPGIAPVSNPGTDRISAGAVPNGS